MAKAAASAGIEALCPHVFNNPYIPKRPSPNQAVFLGLHNSELWSTSPTVFQALFGGSAGGGKSAALLMACAQYVHEPDFFALVIRRTYTELTQPGAIMDLAKQWWIPAGVDWKESEKTFTFPSGAKVLFGYMDGPNDHYRYAGANYHLICWDELTQWKDSHQYDFVSLSRVRRGINSKAPLRVLCASNPGGPGHAWVKRKFIGGTDPDTGRWCKPSWPYIPAKLTENPGIDAKSYIAALSQMQPTLREQLLEGNWDARDPGDYFRPEWFGPLLDPAADIWASRDCNRVRWWDLAASEAKDAAFTAGVRMARHRSGVRAIEHCRAFRATPGLRDDLIVQTAQADGPSVTVGIEIEPGSGGIAQFHSLERRLKSLGFRVVGARPKAESTHAEQMTMMMAPSSDRGKALRAAPVSSCLHRGWQRRSNPADNNGCEWWGNDFNKPLEQERDGIRLFAGPWTQSYLDVICEFPNGATCDEVDATSGAWAYLEAHPAGGQFLHEIPQTQEPKNTVLQKYNERDRGARRGEKDIAGRWMP